MASVVKTSDELFLSGFKAKLSRAIQSSHLVFLLGAGASCPGLKVAGDVEQKITDRLAVGDQAGANNYAVAFLKTFVDPMVALMSGSAKGTVDTSFHQYVDFVSAIDLVLSKRHSSLLPRQATVFSTNYDLFVESAAERSPGIMLNDGFQRTPSLTRRYRLRPETFFDSTMHTSNTYDYRTEVPSINLIKLHGSMTWAREKDAIVNEVLDFEELKTLVTTNPAAVTLYLEKIGVVLPTKAKLHQTVLDRTYYDLLRLYANVLDRESVVMLTFGFSFADEHIRDITIRALRNPTLLVIVTCFDPAELEGLQKLFEGHHNVTILVPDKAGAIDFDWFNGLIAGSVPTSGDDHGNA